VGEPAEDEEDSTEDDETETSIDPSHVVGVDQFIRHSLGVIDTPGEVADAEDQKGPGGGEELVLKGEGGTEGE